MRQHVKQIAYKSQCEQ